MNAMALQFFGTILAAGTAEAVPGWSTFWRYGFRGNEVWRFALLMGVILGTLIVGRIASFSINRSARQMERYEHMAIMRLFLRCLSRPAAVGIFATCGTSGDTPRFPLPSLRTP